MGLKEKRMADLKSALIALGKVHRKSTSSAGDIRLAQKKVRETARLLVESGHAADSDVHTLLNRARQALEV